MTALTFENPVFVTYAIACLLMSLKYLVQAWATVAVMIRTDSGLLNPEDLKKTPFNPNPRDEQMIEAESVSRSRRMQRNDTENLPPFFAVGLLFVLADPSLLVAQIVFYGYVAARLGHTLAYATGQIHEIRAAMFSMGSLLNIGMAGWTLFMVASS